MRARTGLALCGGLTLALGIAVPALAATPPGWQSRERIGGGAGALTSGACFGTLADGAGGNVPSIFLAYGEAAPADVTAVNRAYSPPTNSWATRAVPPAPNRSQFYGGVVIGGKLFCLGGKSGAGVIGDVVRFDSFLRVWDTFAAAPAPVTVSTGTESGSRAGAAIAAEGGDIFLIGGRTSTTPCGGQTLRSILRFDPGDNQWAVAGELPAPRSDAAAAGSGGKILIFGGCDTTATFFGNILVFDPKSGTVTTTSVTLTGGARANAVALADGSRVRLLGGWRTGATDVAASVAPNHLIVEVKKTSPLQVEQRAQIQLPPRCATVGGLAGINRAEMAAARLGDIFAVGGTCLNRNGGRVSLFDTDALKP